MVKVVFEKGYKIHGNYLDHDGNIPLHYACLFCKEEIIKDLLTNECCDPYHKNNEDFSPLYSIVKVKNFEFLKKLLEVLENLFDPNQMLKKRSPLLHCLLEQNYQYHPFDEDYIIGHYSSEKTVSMFKFLLINCNLRLVLISMLQN